MTSEEGSGAETSTREPAARQGQASETPQSADSEEGDTRECEHCGDVFEPYRDWQRFCPGGSCRKAYWREQQKRELEDDLKRHIREHVDEAVEKALETFSY